MDERFARQLRAQTDPLWTAIHGHPFVRAIGDGSMPRETFVFYLAQDYVYLDGFARLLALATTKARGLDDMRRFATLTRLTLEEEMDLHRRTCAEFGLDEVALASVEPGMITSAYTGFLLRTGYEGTVEDILAVLLPCAAGYVEIAQGLRAKGMPDAPHLRDWIDTYTGSEMVELVAWLTERVDMVARNAAPATRLRWLDLYRTSARYELLFFDMAWRREAWPSIVPH